MTRFQHWAAELKFVHSYHAACMESDVNEQTALVEFQNYSPASSRASLTAHNVIVVYVNSVINVNATGSNFSGKQPFKDCEQWDKDSVRDSSDIAELEWTGEAYMCGNCNAMLKLTPSTQESDLEKQLKLQRIQQQIELEALQHEQRMKYLQTLLAT